MLVRAELDFLWPKIDILCAGTKILAQKSDSLFAVAKFRVQIIDSLCMVANDHVLIKYFQCA